MRTILLVVSALALRMTPAAAEKQFVQTCDGNYCFQSFIEKITPTQGGLFKVKTKNVGFNSSTNKKLTEPRWFVVSCNKDDAFVISGRERIEVRQANPNNTLRASHVTKEAEELWKAVCNAQL